MQLFKKNRNLNESTVIPINSFDYDSYVYNSRNIINNSKIEEENICVFLDEAITDHPDFDLLGIKYIASNEYFVSMNRLFDFIESEFGLKVIIAAHPRSTYEATPEIFGGRSIIKGKTAELVIKSKLVIMHMSTSVSFAIIGNKPIIVAKTDGIRQNSYLNKLVDNMAVNIGTKAINIDQLELTASTLSKNINNEKYENYLYKYIKSRNAIDLPVWEIVVLELKNMNGVLNGR
jgi:hypothetical protein